MTAQSRYVLTPGVIDDAARHAFVTGFCAELAVALHDATGWPIVVAGWLNDAGHIDTHYGVLSPTGRILDIEGEHDRHEWADRWGFDGAHGLISRDDVILTGEMSVEAASVFAVAVLERLDSSGN